MITIGLTGGIACGKSLVRAEMERLGVPALDSDSLARTVIRPGETAFQQIVEEFGPELIAGDGTIDRAALGRRIFSEEAARRRLNAIVHPRIIERQQEWLRELRSGSAAGAPSLAVIDAALMIETGNHRRFDRIVVVVCRPEQQLERLMARDGLDRATAQLRIDSQMPIGEKARHADFVIDNSGSTEQTLEQVGEIVAAIGGDQDSCSV